MSQFSVHSYNILSPNLCQPSEYTYLSPDYITPSYRFDKIVKKLDESVNNGAIICLQEVPRQWTGKLHTYFNSKNYSYIESLYGSPFNGYMGVAMAYPMATFKLQDCSIQRISETKHWPKEVPSMIQKLVSWVFTTYRKLFNKKQPFDMLNNSANRNNTLIFSKFVHKTTQEESEETPQEFCVATFHMPCVFFSPQAMQIHTALSATYVQQQAKGLPVVFAGDFNFMPDSPMYKFITTGELPKSDPSYPVLARNDNWTPALSFPFVSAYSKFLGKEPPFTNYSKTTRFDQEFIGTLDYIFASESLTPVSVVPIIDNKALGPFPSKDEPSDHLLIGATFELPQK